MISYHLQLISSSTILLRFIDPFAMPARFYQLIILMPSPVRHDVAARIFMGPWRVP